MRYVMRMIDKETGEITEYKYTTVSQLSKCMGCNTETAELLHTNSHFRRRVGAIKEEINPKRKPKKKKSKKIKRHKMACVQTGEFFNSIREMATKTGARYETVFYTVQRKGHVNINGKDYIETNNVDELNKFAIKKYAELQMEQNKFLESIHFKEKERWEQDEFFMSVSNYINEVEANG